MRERTMGLSRVLLLIVTGTLLCPVALAVDALDVEWQDVSLSVGLGKKEILHGVSGKASAGRLLAVMGPSGSGKTTLLNALAGQIPYSKKTQLHGTLMVGGAERKPDQQQAYVKQEDVFYSQLTVRETLLMAARLRLPRSTPLEEKIAMVDRLISKLGLSKVADTIVGDEKTRGISGGEKKRLSIACQLFGTPSLIFCDEPTTGLDSFQAERVMGTLRQLARDGHTVICSIHQPRSSIFRMFDDVMLLSEGRVMFQGRAERVARYFRSKGHAMPANTNPGDFAVDVVSVDYTSTETEKKTKERIARFDRDYRASSPSGSSYSLLGSAISWPSSSTSSSRSSITSMDSRDGGVAEALASEANKRGSVRHSSTSSTSRAELVSGGSSRGRGMIDREGALEYGQRMTRTGKTAAGRQRRKLWVWRGAGRGSGERAGPVEQFRLLLARSWRQVNRAKFANVTRVIANLGSAVVFGGIFWKLGMGQSNINDRIGLLQTAVIQTAMSTVVKTLVTFPTESTIVQAERSLNMYSVLPYFLSKTIAELPLTALFPSIFGVLMYNMTGLNPKRDRFAKFLGVLVLDAFAAAAFGMLVGCVAKDGDAALAIGPPLMTIFIIFSGFYITQDNVPRYLWWLKDVSMIKQAFEALCVNEMQGLEFDCDNKSRGPCIKTGQQVLDRVSFGESTVEGATLGLGRIIGGCWALTYLSLVLGKPKYQTMLHPSLLTVPAEDAGGALAAGGAVSAITVSGGGGGGRARRKVNGVFEENAVRVKSYHSRSIVEDAASRTHAGGNVAGSARKKTVPKRGGFGIVDTLRRWSERRRGCRRSRSRQRLRVCDGHPSSVPAATESCVGSSDGRPVVGTPVLLRTGKM